MNTHIKNLVMGAIASLAIPLAAHAADPSHGCNELEDDAQRLGCYDAAFGKPRASQGKSVAAPAAAGAAGAAVVASAPATPTASPPKPEVKAKAAPPPSSYQSVVTALAKTADGRFIATLENGELWVQTELDSRTDVKIGDTVTLKRMLFGNYSFVTRTGYTLNVKRVN